MRYLKPSRRRRQNSRLNSFERRKMREKVLERDGAVCWLCEQPIDLTLEAPHPMSLTLDHVIPHSQGGNFRASNLHPAHRRCNFERADAAA